ncbi:DUF6588 family protein [Mesonia sp. K7]|uniref:DUF6588 family protein n=1 Tax=Mesonia sp. K7 TaxID=2218606 RepID=UPI000DB62C04|nr:DUF6588 family protein [Mesonia sp. K7]PZD77593.1 hypothetical protein DNG35_08405 [Mesonia sp. K7]
MKKLLFTLVLISTFAQAQNELTTFIEETYADAQKFGKAYIDPAVIGVMYNVNSGWYHSAKAKDFLEFDIAITGNVTLIKRDRATFNMNVNDYNNIRFSDGSTQKQVATIFGINNPDVVVLLDYDGETTEIQLPQGIEDESVNNAPNMMLQGSVGVFKATELKLRFSPKIKFDNVTKELYGFGLQHEVTRWFDTENFPLDVSALIGFTNVKGFYEAGISDESQLEQGLDIDMQTWNFAAITSTKWEKFNLYGGVSYLTATSENKFRGLYDVLGNNELIQELLNEFTVENKSNGISGTLGVSYEALKNLKINVGGYLQEFPNFEVIVTYRIK